MKLTRDVLNNDGTKESKRRSERRGIIRNSLLMDLPLWGPEAGSATPTQGSPPQISNSKEITIYFDGGCSPNPGRKYGSYEVWVDGQLRASEVRFDLGHGTNNEAEFESLQCALSVVESLAAGRDHKIMVITDSMIVKNRLTGKNRIHKKAAWREASERMFNLASNALKVLNQFDGFSVKWEPRERNVERFGH